jgi:hypothetical protein
MMMNKVYVLCFIMVLLAFQTQAQSQLEKDLDSFRVWVSKKATQADSITRAEWPAIKENFKAKTASLDQKSGSMSQESKNEYDGLKSQYKAMEEKHDEQYGQPLSRDIAKRWEKELAGRSNLKNIRAAELRDVFVYFMEGVRGQRTGWSLRDWDYAEHVYLELSNRKQVVLDKLTNGDKIKIAALQVEFNALRKSRDAKDKYDEMRDKR